MSARILHLIRTTLGLSGQLMRPPEPLADDDGEAQADAAQQRADFGEGS